jgi:bacterioferritin-associated ferredoxin
MRMVRIKLRTNMIVCLCHRVSDRDIADAVRSGCGSFDQLQDDLMVASSCGACADCARDTFESHCIHTCDARGHGCGVVSAAVA